MKKDWREVLRGVKLADLEQHPDRYRKEPYRTAIKEAMEHGAKLISAVRPVVETINRNEVTLHDWIDDPVFGELRVGDIARRLDADASIRGRALARKNTGPRRSRHADKYPKWEEAALDVLRGAGARSRTDKQLVSSVMSVAARGVDRRVVNAWWKNEGDRIRAAAQRRWPNPTRIFGSLKTAL